MLDVLLCLSYRDVRSAKDQMKPSEDRRGVIKNKVGSKRWNKCYPIFKRQTFEIRFSYLFLQSEDIIIVNLKTTTSTKYKNYYI